MSVVGHDRPTSVVGTMSVFPGSGSIAKHRSAMRRANCGLWSDICEKARRLVGKQTHGFSYNFLEQYRRWPHFLD